MIALLALCATISLGCSAPKAAPSAEAPATPATPVAEEEAEAQEPIAGVDEAARRFDQAASELSEVLDPDRGAPSDLGPGDAAAGEAAGAAPAQPPRARRLASDGCERACRALASMRRSAARLCELTGPDDPRCVHVRERLERAEETVSERCPSCAL